MLGNFKKVVSSLSKYIYSSSKNSVKAVGAILTEIITIVINIGAPALIADNLREHYSEEDSDHFSSNPVVLASAVAIFAAQLLPKIRDMLLSSVQASVQKELALGMVRHAYELELDHQLTAETGHFALALSKNYSSVDQIIPSLFGVITPTALEVLALSGFLVSRYGSLGIFPTASLVLFFGVAASREKKMERLRETYLAASFGAYGAIMAAIANYLPAHQFQNVEHELGKVNGALGVSQNLKSSMQRKSHANGLLLAIISNLGYLGTVAFAAFGPKSDDIGIFDFVLIVYYMTRFQAILGTLTPVIGEFYTALDDAMMVLNYLDRPSKIVDNADATDLQLSSAPSIEFRNVTLSFNEQRILNKISFRAEPGSKFAIVGASGSGKSTILNLLQRFYMPDNGAIFIDELDVSKMHSSSVRDNISVVSQSSLLSNAKVRENINYGNLAAGAKDIRQAADMAELTSNGNYEILDKIAGQSGDKLSGGERQRVTIARSLLYGGGGPIFLLDEPTSALDAETEREVQNKLDELTANSTTILVTHRLSTVINADHIIYLSDGEIVERGNFEELMNAKGNFYNQFTIQCQELGIDAQTVHPVRRQQQNFGESQQQYGPVSFWQKRRRLINIPDTSMPREIPSVFYDDSLSTPLLST